MGVMHRFTGENGKYSWEGVAVEAYNTDGAVGGSRQVVIGERDGAVNFCLRYYEIAPGGQSSFDRHQHDHGVYVLRGAARLMMGREVYEIGPGDIVYIPPNEQHQFKNTGDEPFGFLCAVPPRD